MVASDAPGTGIFKTAFSDKKTTGSWAVRFAIYLGYTDISLGGIDCSYVEVIRKADRTGTDLELKIGSEVDANHNYFFDAYKKQGDTYRVPTHDRHIDHRYLQPFEELCFDLGRLGLTVRCRNTDKPSNLHHSGEIKYVPLQATLW